MTRPYHQIPIQECGEPVVKIPLEQFAIESPHPYEKVGAPYQGKSPYYLRQRVLDTLTKAQIYLQQYQANWQIKIFDAYRPVAVQQYMVDYTFAQVVRSRNFKLLSPTQEADIWQQVYQIWAPPSDNPATPPPHSTGGAVDVTLVDAQGNTVDMGSPIDELSARSHPDYYGKSTVEIERKYHQQRQLLHKVMIEAGFCRHTGEWWHFSLGDQMWAWQRQQQNPQQQFIARYGKI